MASEPLFREDRCREVLDCLDCKELFREPMSGGSGRHRILKTTEPPGGVNLSELETWSLVSKVDSTFSVDVTYQIDDDLQDAMRVAPENHILDPSGPERTQI